MLKTIVGLQGVTILSKDAQKKLFGGLAPGTCGNVMTLTDGSRCVSGGISRATAIQNSADYNNAAGDYTNGGYGGITDINWCCASCGNFSDCGDFIDA
jgi:hypothetical protein